MALCTPCCQPTENRGFRERRKVGGNCSETGCCCHLPGWQRGCHGAETVPKASTVPCRCDTATFHRLSPQRALGCWRTARAASCAQRTMAASPATTGCSCSSGGTASASTGCASTPAPLATLACGDWRSTDAQVCPTLAGGPWLVPVSPHHPTGPSTVGRAMAAFPAASLVRVAGPRGCFPFYPELQPGPHTFAKGFGCPAGTGAAGSFHAGSRLAQLTSPPSRQSAGLPAARAVSAETSA